MDEVAIKVSPTANNSEKNKYSSSSENKSEKQKKRKKTVAEGIWTKIGVILAFIGVAVTVLIGVGIIHPFGDSLNGENKIVGNYENALKFISDVLQFKNENTDKVVTNSTVVSSSVNLAKKDQDSSAPVLSQISIAGVNSIVAGTTNSFIVNGVDQFNKGIAISAPIVWSSSDSSIATAENGGIINGIAPGTATITATVGNLTGTMILKVTAK